MVKRFRAWILAIMLLVSSGGLAKAESPKGEAKKTNKTNIETQAPVERASNENEIVKVNEATGEEVIIGQESQEEIELQARLQQICSKIDEVALELDGETQEITIKEYYSRIKNIVDAINSIAKYENIKVGATTYFNVVAFEYLPKEIQSKVISNYTNNYEKFCDDFLDGALPIPGYASDDINLAMQFCCSEAQEDLTQMFDEMCKGLSSEVEKGQLGGINFTVILSALNYAKNTLSNSGVLSFIVDTYGSTVYSIIFSDIKKLDDFSKYFDGWGRREGNNPLPENPATEADMLLVYFNDFGDLLEKYQTNASEVLDNKVDIFLGQEK